jgi:hypothetical protein
MPIAALRWPDKDPAEVLDYGLDWSDQLALTDPNDTISSATWTVPAGLIAGAQFVIDGVATIWLSGGTAGANGTDYTLTCRIVTSGGRTLERSVKLMVKEL